MEPPGINILLDSWIFAQFAVCQAERRIRDHIRSHEPGGLHHERELAILIILNQDGWDAEPVAQDELGTRPVRYRQGRFFTNHNRSQLKGAINQTSALHRSEERRVGKERRSLWSPSHYKKR